MSKDTSLKYFFFCSQSVNKQENATAAKLFRKSKNVYSLFQQKNIHKIWDNQNVKCEFECVADTKFQKHKTSFERLF